jgi:hypothetical protein
MVTLKLAPMSEESNKPLIIAMYHDYAGGAEVSKTYYL